MEGSHLNTTIFRTNFYPTLEGMSEEELADGVVRIGQHADYGSITLLVQDDIGGLEVNIMIIHQQIRYIYIIFKL